MELKVLDLSHGILKVTMAGISFIFNSEKDIERITKIEDITEDGILVVECIKKDFSRPVIQWINLKPFLVSIHRENLLDYCNEYTDFVVVS